MEHPTLSAGWILEKVQTNDYKYSHHADEERKAESLLLTQIEEALIQGKVIENYPDTGRGESCLVAGIASDGTPIHAVVGEREDSMIIITTYVPRPPKFTNPFERSRN